MSSGGARPTGSQQLMLHYDTRDWPRGTAFEFDREVLRTTYDLLRPAGTHGDHWFKSKVRLVGNMMLAQNDVAGGHTLVRSRQHIEDNPGAYLKVQLFTKPGGSLLSSGGLVALDPGSVFLIDQSRPYRQTMPGGQNLTLFLPYARVNYDPTRLPPILRLGQETTEGRFLAHSMRIYFRFLKTASAESAMALSQAVCGVVSGLCGEPVRGCAPPDRPQLCRSRVWTGGCAARGGRLASIDLPGLRPHGRPDGIHTGPSA